MNLSPQNEMPLTFRQAKSEDLKAIVWLLGQDELGESREILAPAVDERYLTAFHEINQDGNQYLMVTELKNEIVGTCHLTLMPSLTFSGSKRLQIEAVRVHPDVRGQNIGKQMIEHALAYGKSRGVTIVQLTTNKHRQDALRFYEKLGFQATHAGMKLYLATK